MRKKLFLLLLGLAVFVFQVRSQTFYEWFEKNNISIRKTFDGSKKDEDKPANFFWGKDFENDFSYTTFDFGLKISQIELLGNTKESSLLFYPKLEWHKDGSKKDKEKDNLSAGVNMEFIPVTAKAPGFSGWKLVPWLLGSLDYQNDYIKELKTVKLKGYVSLFGTTAGLPGSDIRNGGGALILRYYPYSGIERFTNTDSSSKSATFWANRIFFEFFPVTTLEKQFIQITFDYTYRSKLKDKLYGNENLSWFALGLNFYPDGQGKIGLGFEYSKGEDPSDNFTVTKKINFGVKIKL